MFERFTQQAREVVVLAQDEARTHGHNYIGSEHILLGLLRDPESPACRILESRSIELTGVLEWLTRTVGRGEWRATGEMAFTPSAKKALELSVQAAQELGHTEVGAEHILLGLTGVGDGLAVRAMIDLGTAPQLLVDDLLDEIGPQGGTTRFRAH